MHNNYKRLILVTVLAGLGHAWAQGPAAERNAAARTAAARAAAASPPALQPCVRVVVEPPTIVTLGKSSVIQLSAPVARMVVGGQPSTRTASPAGPQDKSASPTVPAPAGGNTGGGYGAANANDGVASVDITLLSPTELFILGKKSGSMNVVLQSSDGRCYVRDVVVAIDPNTLQSTLADMMPEETGIRVRGAENALVLTGRVSDALKLDEVMSLATSYGDGRKVVNLLRVTAPQQVMLEVKIAEVSKTLLDKLGASAFLTDTASGGRNTYTLLSNFLSGGGGLVQALRSRAGALEIDAQKNDGLVRVLAEPNIMAISGQAASFLSGGKIFIPVSQTSDTGVPTITLQEKEFGIGVKFTPTVLGGGRVNLKMVSEVSDLSQTGSPFTTVNGNTAVLPSFTVRRADTTVQLGDGQSFVIAGLIKNNISQTIKRFPGFGEVPVLGALFRSTEFQNDQTELLFVVTPRLVQPLTTAVNLPTDNHVPPDRVDVFLLGTAEGKKKAPAAVRIPADSLQAK